MDLKASLPIYFTKKDNSWTIFVLYGPAEDVLSPPPKTLSRQRRNPSAKVIPLHPSIITLLKTSPLLKRSPAKNVLPCRRRLLPKMFPPLKTFPLEDIPPTKKVAKEVIPAKTIPLGKDVFHGKYFPFRQRCLPPVIIFPPAEVVPPTGGFTPV